jgi:predicted permease
MNLFSDLKLALRQLRRAPGYSLVTILTLALGIGVNVAIFGLLYSVGLRSLPSPDSDQLVRALPETFITGEQFDVLSEELAASGQSAFEALTVAASGGLVLTGEGRPMQVGATVVDSSHFDVFERQPILGRRLTAQDTQVGAEPVALLSYGLWQSHFGGDEGVVGRTLDLSGEGASRRTIVGVMPADYDIVPWRSEVLVPLVREAGSHDWQDMARYWLLARRADTADLEVGSQALAAAVAAAMARPETGFHEELAADARVVGYLESWVGPSAQRLRLMLLAVLAVLLVACVNVSHLVSTRLLGREQELAIRSALGAERVMLVRQMLLEAGVLALIGGAVGALLAVLALRFTVTAGVFSGILERSDDLHIGWPVFVFGFLLSCATGLIFALTPAWRSTAHLDRALSEAGRSAGVSASSSRRSAALVAVQVALCTVLVVGAGLLVKSLWQLSQVDPGFEPQGVLSIHLEPPASTYGEEDQRRAYYREVEASLAALPQVEVVGSVNLLPLSRGVLGLAISPDGDPVPATQRPMFVRYRLVTPGYIETLGLGLLQGRGLLSTDRSGTEPVGMINRTLAQRLWPGQSAVGRQIAWDDGSPWLTVVGVINDFYQRRLSTPPEPEVYVSYEQDAFVAGLNVMVRTRAGTEILPTLRDAVWAIDPDVALSGEARLIDVVSESMAQPRFYASLFLGFALLALTLGAIGVYGVLALSVRRRAHEMGVRAALGADGSQLMRSALSQSLWPVAIGLILGTALSLLSTPLLASLLFQVDTSDKGVLATTIALLAGVAFLASLGPALRAARIDPLQVLGGD